jgi:hypothetical protein
MMDRNLFSYLYFLIALQVYCTFKMHAVSNMIDLKSLMIVRLELVLILGLLHGKTLSGLLDFLLRWVRPFLF